MEADRGRNFHIVKIYCHYYSLISNIVVIADSNISGNISGNCVINMVDLSTQFLEKVVTTSYISNITGNLVSNITTCGNLESRYISV